MGIYLLILLNIGLLVIGQILWKMGLTQIGPVTAKNALTVALSPYILGGLALYVIATGLWFYLLSRVDLSYIYPLQSLAYVFGTLAGVLLFNEIVPLTRWLGLAVIIFGVYLVTLK